MESMKSKKHFEKALIETAETEFFIFQRWIFDPTPTSNAWFELNISGNR